LSKQFYGNQQRSGILPNFLGVHKLNKIKLVWLTENGQKPSNTGKYFPPEIENVDNWSELQKSQMPELVSI
jgi:hypothetical protein